jgi:hypothetical protein
VVEVDGIAVVVALCIVVEDVTEVVFTHSTPLTYMP